MHTIEQLNFPPLDGTLNLAEAVNFNLEHNKEQTFYIFSPDHDSQNNVCISHLEFGRATHRAAHIIRPDRHDGKDALVVGIIALVDTMVYQAVAIGLMQAGYVPFLISPRNSPAAIVQLIRQTSCHTILGTQHTLKVLLDSVKNELTRNIPDFELEIREIPTIHDLFPRLGQEIESDSFRPYPSSEERASFTAVAMYLHSSGSTGFPKPIPQTFQTIIEWSITFGIKESGEFRPRLCVGGMSLPPFHGYGIAIQTYQPIYGLLPVALYPPTVLKPESYPFVTTPQNLMEHLKATKCNTVSVVPSVLKEWSESDEIVKILSSFQSVAYAGGGLAREIGEKLVAAGINLHSLYAGTEFGPVDVLPLTRRRNEDWEWVTFSNRLHINWEDQGNGTYEFQVLTHDQHHPAIENLSNPNGYATSDIFEKHPYKPGLWRIVGRKDDVIIHSSGEKTVPAPMEAVIMNNTKIRGAVMFGRMHNQPGVLVEPSVGCFSHEESVAFRDSIWHTIEEANQQAPAFSRIYEEMIIVTTPHKPLPRSPKDTLIRNAALALYDDEIKHLYKSVMMSAGGKHVAPPPDWKVETVKQWLLKQVCDILSQNDISPTRDLFEQGLDSLSATFLRLRIISILRSSDKTQSSMPELAQDVIYNYPIIQDLAGFMVGVVEHLNVSSTVTNGKEAVESMIKKFSIGLDYKNLNRPNPSSGPRNDSVILLTGSTGNIMAQVLFLLLQNSSVSKIYTVNRPSQGGQTIFKRHEAMFKNKGLDPSLLQSKKVVFLESQPSYDDLGQDKNLYYEMQNSVTHIIHGAWRLDFNLTLASFESNIRGTRNLIDFARNGPSSSTLRFVFMSSVGSVQSWNSSLGPYPEKMVDDVTYALGGGYGEAKYIAERILACSGLQVCSLRIGQVSGGLPNGAWATSDWLPILVKSSLTLGSLPDTEQLVTWMAMDAVAQVIIDVTLKEDAVPFALNVVHPRPVPWLDIINAIAESISYTPRAEKILNIISFDQWLKRVEDRAMNATLEDFENIPAIKILDFYRSMRKLDQTEFETTEAQKVSQTMRVMHSLGREDAQRWVDYWRSVKYID